MDLVVGVDAGGTASRAVVATLSGEIVGRGVAGPGNPVSCGPGAATAIFAALRDALAAPGLRDALAAPALRDALAAPALRDAPTGRDPASAGASAPSSPACRVAGGVLGLAGTSAVSSPAIAAAFAEMWAALGLTCPMRIVGDVVTAFAAGTPSPSGAVLIAGTGAIAARIDNHEIAATADGLGWLLGDEGSGRWIGLQALRHAVRDWSSPFAKSVAAHAAVISPDDLIAWAQSFPLPDIDALAPLVCAATRTGDPTARAITGEAVSRLLTTLDEVTTPGGTTAPHGTAEPPGEAAPDEMVKPDGTATRGPVVLAGGLLAGDTPVRDGVLAALDARRTPTGTGRDPAAAAAWLAARPLTPLGPAELHAALLA